MGWGSQYLTNRPVEFLGCVLQYQRHGLPSKTGEEEAGQNEKDICVASQISHGLEEFVDFAIETHHDRLSTVTGYFIMSKRNCLVYHMMRV